MTIQSDTRMAWIVAFPYSALALHDKHTAPASLFVFVFVSLWLAWLVSRQKRELSNNDNDYFDNSNNKRETNKKDHEGCGTHAHAVHYTHLPF